MRLICCVNIVIGTPNVKEYRKCSPLGPAVPSIDLVLQSRNVWRLFGANSRVAVNKDVMCLGFVQARTDLTATIPVVIGGHQIEDNLLQFDLTESRLGFSSSLLGRSTSCANFNFKPMA